MSLLLAAQSGHAAVVARCPLLGVSVCYRLGLYDFRFWQILLQKSFCEVGLKFSDPWVQRLNNDVGDHVAKRQTHRRFW